MVTLFKNWSRITTDDHGAMTGAALQGFFSTETRFVSHFRLTVNGKPLSHRLSTQLSATEWASIGLEDAPLRSAGNLPEGEVPRGTLEIRLLRHLGEGLSEKLAFRNHDSRSRTVRARLELVCPIDDVERREELKGGRIASGEGVKPRLLRLEGGVLLRYRRNFGPRRKTPTRELRRSYGKHAPVDGESVLRDLEIRVRSGQGSSPIHLEVRAGKTSVIELETEIPPKSEAVLLLDYEPIIDGHRSRAPGEPRPEPLPRAESNAHSEFPEIVTGNSTLNLILGQALSDLKDLRLSPYGEEKGHAGTGWGAFIAGVPRYLGIFGRDTLITAWQSAILGRDLMEPALTRVSKLRGVRFDAWRDEEPFRLPHERRVNPASEAGRTNRLLYYGDVTATPFWVIALSMIFRTTGDVESLARHAEALEDCCSWILWRLRQGRGFLYYAPALPPSKGTNRNQAWKDSGDAIVDENGRVRVPPVAVAEIQGYAYRALREAAALYHALGERAKVGGLLREAARLKEEFNRRFWLPEERYYAFALASGMRPIRSRVSNPGHCLSCGIVDEDKAPGLVRGLMAPDMFSGWGVRTLSAENPAYDPFSYHRGSVWPVENSIIAEGMARCGFRDEALRIIEGQLSLASAFPHLRLPEVLSGHERSRETPMPGIYPFANPLQAWSVSAIFQFLQTLLGLYPYAQSRTLLLDPALPDWLPWVELRGLRVAGARLDLRFHRSADGKSQWEVLNKRGELEIRRGHPATDEDKLIFARGAQVA